MRTRFAVFHSAPKFGSPTKFQTKLNFASKSSIFFRPISNHGQRGKQVSSLPGTPISEDEEKRHSNAVGRNLIHIWEQHKNEVKVPKRNFIQFNPKNVPPNSDTLSVVSYNVLAESVLEGTGSLITKIPADKRYIILLQELISYKADILCLQEVEKRIFRDLLEPVLEGLGYSGIYSQVGHGDFESSRDWTENRLHGCATFWNTNKFRKVKNEFHELRQAIYMNGTKQFGMGHQLFLKDFVRKSNIVTLLFLETVNPQKPYNQVCISNTHLLANVNKTAVRTIQARTAIHCIQDFISHLPIPLPRDKEEPQIKSWKETPIIFCGDFNSFPHSSTYRLFTQGHLPKTEPELKVFGEDIARDDIRQPIKFSSLYGDTIGEPIQTTNAATVDYVWFTPHTLVPKKLVEIKKITTSLPTIEYPSDHVALFGEFYWK